MNARRPCSSVVVAGRDIPLWLGAAALAQALGPTGLRVVAVELPARLSASDVVATLPPMEALHAKLRIAEEALIRATRGSYSFGQNVVDLSGGMPNFFHAWASYGAPIDGKAFFSCWTRARRQGLKVSLQDFCPTAVAAGNGRMLLPDEETTAFGRTDYGYHVNAMAYAGYLKSVAAALGVTIHSAGSIAVERSKQGGDIVALAIDGSRRIEGDFFVDATGEDAALIGQLPGDAWTDWRRHFNVDRVLSAQAPPFTSVPPFAEIRASSAGWAVLHPARSGTGIVYACSRDMQRDEDAVRSASIACKAALTGVEFRASTPGFRASPWQANCVAIGRAACRLDPVHDVDLHAVQLGIVHLLALFPATTRFGAERDEYNRVMRSWLERIRDFQCAFYALSPYDGQFWERARRVDVPPELAHKIAIFRARAAIAPMEDETFAPDSWQALFTGLGITPESWTPAVDLVPRKRLDIEFRRMLGFIKDKVLEQPTHDAYLARTAPESVP